MTLIDKTELLQNIQKHAGASDDDPYSFIEDVLYMINNAKEVDAVQMVRCADCENWDTSWKPLQAPNDNMELHFCPTTDEFHYADWFCADGVRKVVTNQCKSD